MKLLKSKLGLTFSLLYLAVGIFLILSQGLFGESFIAITLGLPWSYFLVWSILHEAVNIYVAILGPIILNTVLLYWIGVGIQKLFSKNNSEQKMVQ